MLLVDIVHPSTKFRDPLLEFQYVTKVQLPEIKPIWGYEFRIPCTKQANLREKTCITQSIMSTQHTPMVCLS